MALAATFDGDVRVKGTLTPDSLEPPAASIGNAAIKTGSTGNKVAKEKIEHMVTCHTSFGGNNTSALPSSSDEWEVYIAPRAGTLHSFRATMTTTGTTGNSDFDLLVNGSSVLSAAVNITNSDADNIVTTGTISSTALAAGDRVTIKVTKNSSHDGTGPSAQAELYYEL